VERGTHSELLDLRGRYFDLYTRQAGLEANRFINPGERDAEPEIVANEARRDGRGSLGEVAQDVFGFRRPGSN
jgi:hypothetical protein